MSKRNLETLKIVLGVLSVISLFTFALLTFIYGKDLFHFVKDFTSADVFFAWTYTIGCLLFFLVFFTKVEELVLKKIEKIEKIENDKALKFLAKKRACNLYLKN